MIEEKIKYEIPKLVNFIVNKNLGACTLYGSGDVDDCFEGAAAGGGCCGEGGVAEGYGCSHGTGAGGDNFCDSGTTPQS